MSAMGLAVSFLKRDLRYWAAMGAAAGAGVAAATTVAGLGALLATQASNSGWLTTRTMMGM
jgi:hypothetical protein